jgi:hypothetical protein
MLRKIFGFNKEEDGKQFIIFQKEELKIYTGRSELTI